MNDDRPIQDRAAFDRIRYANVWEDADVLAEALAPALHGRILSIASGGDNAFALLAAGGEGVAADISMAQLACVELKRAAIARLDEEELLSFLGLSPSTRRLFLYRSLRRHLGESSRTFWDENRTLVEKGIVHAGKFENFFRIFRDWVVPLIHGERSVNELFLERDPEALAQFYERTWNNRRWRLMFHVFFSRWVVGRLGRDPEFFRYVEGSVARHILERTRHGLSEVAVHDNPYLHYIFRGTFLPARPAYLRSENLEPLRRNLHRLTLHHGPIQEAACRWEGPGFDGFNLSDIFEYLDPSSCEEVYGALLERARPAARFAYWNMMVPRRCPETLSHRVRSLDSLAKSLHERDRAFFYRAFIIEELRSDPGKVA